MAYAYDVLDNLTYHDPQTATAHAKNTHFLWQGLRLLSETQHQPEQPTTTRLYCYEQNSYAPLARIDTTGDDLNSPQVYYFHTDVTGTPKEVTDTTGQIVWQADYKAWGEIDLYRFHLIDQPLRFQGQYADDETGLYYTTFRYYDPHAGRFTTQDPIGLAGGWNLYQYAPNPTGWVDPLGLSSCWDTARKNYWKKIGEQETNNPSGKYSLDNILRMLSGRAPRFKAKIKLRKSGAEVERNISYELHHKDIPQRQGGKGVHDDNNLLEVTPWEHEAIDPYRHTGSDLIEITKGIDKWTGQ